MTLGSLPTLNKEQYQETDHSHQEENRNQIKQQQ